MPGGLRQFTHQLTHEPVVSRFPDVFQSSLYKLLSDFLISRPHDDRAVIAGAAPGSGGGGAYDLGFTSTAYTGGDGADGILILEEFA